MSILKLSKPNPSWVSQDVGIAYHYLQGSTEQTGGGALSSNTTASILLPPTPTHTATPTTTHHHNCLVVWKRPVPLGAACVVVVDEGDGIPPWLFKGFPLQPTVARNQIKQS